MITAQSNDPRVPGGTYLCGYWQQTYTVEAMFSMVDGRDWWIRVRWDDGTTGTHCTPWNARRDRAVQG